MLLRKVILSTVVSVFLGMLGVTISYDFQNYAEYASRAEAATARFATEPIFPLFIILSNVLDLPSEAVIQLFMTVGCFFMVYAVITLSNQREKWSLMRSLIALTASMPFVLFSVMVPRQGLALGMVLCALINVRNDNSIASLRTILLLVIAGLTHNITGLFGVLLILAGYINIRVTMMVGMLFIVFFLSIFGLFYSESMGLDVFGYGSYIGNFRETGLGRLILFVSVALIYITLISHHNGGVFSRTPIRNLGAAIVYSITCIFLYFSVATDTIRLTYLIGILMICEITRRICLGYKN